MSRAKRARCPPDTTVASTVDNRLQIRSEIRVPLSQVCYGDSCRSSSLGASNGALSSGRPVSRVLSGVSREAIRSIAHKPPRDQGRGAAFYTVVAWARLGQLVARQFTKGQMIRVDGSVQRRPWQSKAGQAPRTVEVVADWCYCVPRDWTGRSLEARMACVVSRPLSMRLADAAHS
jgi:hypothetical protein